jgi:hypothetical protein
MEIPITSFSNKAATTKREEVVECGVLIGTPGDPARLDECHRRLSRDIICRVGIRLLLLDEPV